MQFGGDGRQRLLQRAQGSLEFQQVYPLPKRAAEQVRETGDHLQSRQQLVGRLVWLGEIAP
jgi:hypothetical protein